MTTPTIAEAYQYLWPEGHSRPDPTSIIVEVEGGIAVLTANGYLEAVYVDPSRRRRGVGKALMASVLDRCVSMGLRQITTDTWDDHRSAEGWLRSLGFVDDVPRDGVDVSLRLSL